jgi:hypothetical protein
MSAQSIYGVFLATLIGCCTPPPGENDIPLKGYTHVIWDESELTPRLPLHVVQYWDGYVSTKCVAFDLVGNPFLVAEEMCRTFTAAARPSGR